MKIDIEYISNLARLKLDDSDKQKFSEQLMKILDYMDKLNTVNTGNVVPTSHPVDLKQSGVTESLQRDDVVKQYDNKQKLLENAPESEAAYFKVPKVIG